MRQHGQFIHNVRRQTDTQCIGAIKCICYRCCICIYENRKFDYATVASGKWQTARGKRQMQLWHQAAKTIKIQARGQPREPTTRGNKECATATATTTGQPQHGKHETETVTKTARQPHARSAMAVAVCVCVCGNKIESIASATS